MAPVILAASYPPRIRFPSICKEVVAPVKPQKRDHIFDGIRFAEDKALRIVELRPRPKPLIWNSLDRIIPSGKPCSEVFKLSLKASAPKMPPLSDHGNNSPADTASACFPSSDQVEEEPSLNKPPRTAVHRIAVSFPHSPLPS